MAAFPGGPGSTSQATAPSPPAPLSRPAGQARGGNWRFERFSLWLRGESSGMVHRRQRMSLRQGHDRPPARRFKCGSCRVRAGAPLQACGTRRLHSRATQQEPHQTLKSGPALHRCSRQSSHELFSPCANWRGSTCQNSKIGFALPLLVGAIHESPLPSLSAATTKPAGRPYNRALQ